MNSPDQPELASGYPDPDQLSELMDTFTHASLSDFLPDTPAPEPEAFDAALGWKLVHALRSWSATPHGTFEEDEDKKRALMDEAFIRLLERCAEVDQARTPTDRILPVDQD